MLFSPRRHPFAGAGTGYSSLTHLKRLPMDQLKIDQSFVRDLLTDPDDAQICQTIVALGHNLGMQEALAPAQSYIEIGL